MAKKRKKIKEKKYKDIRNNKEKRVNERLEKIKRIKVESENFVDERQIFNWRHNEKDKIALKKKKEWKEKNK